MAFHGIHGIPHICTACRLQTWKLWEVMSQILCQVFESVEAMPCEVNPCLRGDANLKQDGAQQGVVIKPRLPFGTSQHSQGPALTSFNDLEWNDLE